MERLCNVDRVCRYRSSIIIIWGLLTFQTWAGLVQELVAAQDSRPSGLSKAITLIIASARSVLSFTLRTAGRTDP